MDGIKAVNINMIVAETKRGKTQAYILDYNQTALKNYNSIAEEFLCKNVPCEWFKLKPSCIMTFISNNLNFAYKNCCRLEILDTMDSLYRKFYC